MMPFPANRTQVLAAPRIQAMRDATPLVMTICLGIYIVVVIRTAWLCDDAYITFRTVDNFVGGYGPRWNVVERVQVYTHPLWMLVVAVPYAFTHEAYFTPLILSIGLSCAAVWLFATQIAASWTTVLVGAAALIFSKAFVDYSTSGLENPLTHLLLAVFLCVYWHARQSENRGVVAVWLVSGLIILNRLDLALLVVPAVVAASWPYRWTRVARAAAIGWAPLVVWELFSIVYYGFLLPNPAYAKLATGVSTAALLAQGLVYVLDSFAHDPVTLLAVVAFTTACISVNPREHWPVALGITLYGLYVVRVGGDFMSGRFLTPLLFCAVAMFAHERWRLPAGAVAVVVGAIALLGVLATSTPPMTSGPGTYVLLSDSNAIPASGVGDERVLYYGYTGLLRWSRARPLPFNDQVVRGSALKRSPCIVVSPSVGLVGYFAGPEPHLIDPFGLADPLLARLPALPDWRIGHYERTVPDGYEETVRTGRNVIANPAVAARYEQLKLITQGPLWSRRRWQAIRICNLGR